MLAALAAVPLVSAALTTGRREVEQLSGALSHVWADSI